MNYFLEQVLEERGASKKREFVIQASVKGYACKGGGPNKKIAKRNAAQALLTVLGYATVNQNVNKLPVKVSNQCSKYFENIINKIKNRNLILKSDFK